LRERGKELGVLVTEETGGREGEKKLEKRKSLPAWRRTVGTETRTQIRLGAKEAVRDISASQREHESRRKFAKTGSGEKRTGTLSSWI